VNEPLPREVAGFLRRHWWHLLLLIPGALLVTIIHEAAHAAAVIAQGGTVTEFVWWPSHREWGHIQFTFPAGTHYSDFLISLAPGLLSVTLAVTTAAITFWRQPKSYAGASWVFVWLYCVPVLDVAYAAFPYLAGKQNDFAMAFGKPAAGSTVWIVLVALVFLALGYFVQRQLYREARLSPLAYLALSGSVGVAVVAVTM